MNGANNLVPVSDEELEVADSMLASLTDIAYSTPSSNKPAAPSRPRRRSRFFFKLSKSFVDETEARKRTFVPKQMVHVDAEVTKRLKEYKREIPPELAGNIDSVREFFLKEIAPITLATGAGATQAREVVKRLVGSDVDGTQFEKFERMMALAVDIKMSRFVARLLGLTKAEGAEIINAMKPRTPQIVPIGLPHHENQRPEKRSRPKGRQEAPEKAPDF
jgi:hypothetical protein